MRKKYKIVISMFFILLLTGVGVWLYRIEPFKTKFEVRESLGGNLFPSLLLSTATTDTVIVQPMDTAWLGNPKSGIGVFVSSSRGVSRVRIHIGETAFSYESISEFVLEKSNTDYLIYPEIGWKYDVLRNNTQALPISLAVSVEKNKVNLGTQIVTVASSVLLPRSAYLLEQGRKKEFHSLIKSSLQFSLVISCPMIALCILNAYQLIMLLSGSGFMPAIPVMQIEIIATMFIGMTNVIGVQLFIPMDREKHVFYSTLCGAIAGIILNSLLIPTLGASGAAISTVLAEAGVLIAQLIQIKKLKVNIISIAEIAKILASTLFASIVAYFASNSFTGIFSSIVISCLTFGIAYLGLLLLSREKALMLIIRGRME